jgi:hypothetical protein
MAHLPVLFKAAVLDAQLFPDKLAITGRRIKLRRQFFLKINGKDGYSRLEAASETVYQVFGFFFQKNVNSAHTGKYTIELRKSPRFFLKETWTTKKGGGRMKYIFCD